MLDWVGLLLRGIYNYGHFIGLSNFEFDWRTGRVFTAARSTLYAIAVNGAVVLLLVFQLNRHVNFDVIFGSSNKLHETVIIIMTSLRIVAGLTTVLNRWRQRCQMRHLVRKILRLCLAKPQVVRMCRWGILIKFITSLLTDIFQLAITLDAIGRADSAFFLAMFFQFWLSAIINLAIAQHYLVMLFLRAQYQLLNMELRQVVTESKDLSYHPPRRGVFMTRCCFLADQLDNIAKLQSQLQSVLRKLAKVFGVQGLMVNAGYYISSVASSYMAYSIIKNGPENLGLSQRATVLVFGWCIFYYWDAFLNLFIILYVQDDHKAMIRMLEERTLFASGLDVRLEESFERLQLQLIQNPLKIEVLKMFRLNRDTTSAMLGSFITHSIFLIQYDIQFF